MTDLLFRKMLVLPRAEVRVRYTLVRDVAKEFHGSNLLKNVAQLLRASRLPRETSFPAPFPPAGNSAGNCRSAATTSRRQHIDP
jgi:hypothetical protein